MVPTSADLFERYHVVTYRYFLRATGSPDVAQDLLQELFVRVLRSIKTYRPENEAGWIYRIASHVLADFRRSRGASLVPLTDAPDLRTEATQLVAFSLSEALALLPEQDREVFVLREVTGLSYAELARVCDMPIDTVRSRMTRVRCRLRGLLGPRLAADENRRRNGET